MNGPSGMRDQSFVLLPDARRGRIVESLLSFLHRLPADVPFRVTIARERKERSDPQNAYLWGVCYAALARATGHKPEDWHEYFCGEFFGWREVEKPGGRVEHVPRRSTTRDEYGKRSVMPAGDFSDFIEMIQAKAAENGVFIPDAEAADAARWAA